MMTTSQPTTNEQIADALLKLVGISKNFPKKPFEKW